MTVKTKEKEMNPKDALDRDAKISIGDVVTIDDDSSIIETYIVRKINDTLATICGIAITPEKDDVYIKEISIPVKSLLYLGTPFINVNGYLWRVREAILKNKPFCAI